MLFSEIIGHNSVKNRLIRTVLENRVSHAQLFLGPEGSEKLALALAYGQFIACQHKNMKPDDASLLADSCGQCPSCIKYQKLAHPDLHFIYPVAATKKITSKPVSENFLPEWRQALIESNYYLNLNEWYEYLGIENKQARIGVDDANQILRTLSLKSFESEYTVIIIWMVEKLFHAAAPKLLKILEEPPDKTLFILVTENHDQILNTIISRTQLVKLYAHPDDEMHQYLEKFYTLSNDRINQIINHSEGSYKKAFDLIDDSEKDDFNYTHFREMMLYSYNNNLLKMREKLTQIADIGRERLKQLLNYGLHITRLCLLYDLNTASLIRSEGQEYEFVSKFSKFVNRNNAAQIMELLSQAINHIERNGNAKIILLDLMLKTAQVIKK